MKRIMTLLAIALSVSAGACTTTEKRVGGAAMGGVFGAAIAGPVGAGVGAAAGAVTAPTVAR